MSGPELVRSRRLIIAGALAVACTVVLFWWARWPPPPLALFAVILTSAMAGAARRRGRLHLRNLRFAETSRGLAVSVTPSFAVAVTLQWGAVAVLLPTVVTDFGPSVDADPYEARVDWVFTIVMTALVLLTIVLVSRSMAVAWRGVAIELTPVGVRTSGPLSDRLIPWQALAPGGPARPALTADRLPLDVVRPELIDQRGWESGWGTRHDPRVNLRENIHPWVLADAIRWYVEHPADRDALGTAGAQDRPFAAVIRVGQ